MGSRKSNEFELRIIMFINEGIYMDNMQFNSDASMEMPKYLCTKQVWALKIQGIVYDDKASSYFIIPEDRKYAKFKIPTEWVVKHNPVPGGYYVVYKDGYKSFSPAEAFEEGYTRI